MLRLSKDLRLLNVASFSEIILLADSLGRQTQGWINHTTIIKNMYARSILRDTFESLQATVNSYFGILRQANAYKERKFMAKYLGKRGCWFDGQLTKLIRKGTPLCTSA